MHQEATGERINNTQSSILTGITNPGGKILGKPHILFPLRPC